MADPSFAVENEKRQSAIGARHSAKHQNMTRIARI